MAWLARNSNKYGGYLYLYENKPTRGDTIWNAKGNCWHMSCGFDKVYCGKIIKWEDEPVEIGIKIKED